MTSRMAVKTAEVSRPFISGVLLAAGTSSRYYGRPKQVEELEGVSLAARAVSALKGSKVSETIVVLGFQSRRVLLSLGGTEVRVAINPRFATGLSSSLRMGVQAADRRSAGVLVCLADQPFVTSALLDRIIDEFTRTRAAAVAASCGDVVSPPILLSRKLFDEVERLSGDKGAKAIAVAQPSFRRVEVDPLEVLDVDTKEAMAEARRVLADRSMTKRARGQGGGRT